MKIYFMEWLVFVSFIIAFILIGIIFIDDKKTVTLLTAEWVCTSLADKGCTQWTKVYIGVSRDKIIMDWSESLLNINKFMKQMEHELNLKNYQEAKKLSFDVENLLFQLRAAIYSKDQ